MISANMKRTQAIFCELFATFTYGFSAYSAIIGISQTKKVIGSIIIAINLSFSGVAIIYVFCDVTIVHLNPMMTLASIVTKKLPARVGLAFMLAQFLGFIFAAFSVCLCFPGDYYQKIEILRPKFNTDIIGKGRAFTSEMFLSAILVYVAFSVSINPYEPLKDEEGTLLTPDFKLGVNRKIVAPIAVGFTRGFLGICAFINSRGAFNPGIVFAPCLLTGNWSLSYIYFSGELVGGLIGAHLQALMGEMFASFMFGFSAYSTIIGTSQTKSAIASITVALSLAFSSTAIIYAFRDVSIAHFNPIITFAAVVTKRTPFKMGIMYIIAQFVGFILAAFVVGACFPGGYLEKLNIMRQRFDTSKISRGTAFTAETFLTFILIYIAFSVRVNPYKPLRDEKGILLNPEEPLIYGRRIPVPITLGCVRGFLGLCAFRNSKGSFNPGIVFAPCLLSGNWSLSWVYFLGEFTGGMVGAHLQVYLLTKLD